MEATFLSSGVLAQQIKQGAPYDVFMAANEAFVRDLAGGGFVRPDSVQAYARGSLVLAVHGDLGDRIRSLADLARPEVKKIALANPEAAPYGKAGKQALERAGLWQSLQPRIVMAESVRQALLYAQKGDAEAGLVGRAIAECPRGPVDRDRSGLYDPIVQAMGIVADSSRQTDAEASRSSCSGRGRRSRSLDSSRRGRSSAGRSSRHDDSRSYGGHSRFVTAPIIERDGGPSVARVPLATSFATRVAMSRPRSLRLSLRVARWRRC